MEKGGLRKIIAVGVSFIQYFIIGVVLFITVSAFRFRYPFVAVLSIGCAIAYVDEPLWQHIFIDMAGLLLALVLFSLKR
jgi:VanZ family protein